MKRPLLVCLAGYCLGLVLVSYLRVNFWIILGLGVVVFCLAGFFLKKDYYFVILVFSLAVFLGALNLKSSYLRPKCDLSNFLQYHDDRVYSLSGFVASFPEVKNNCTSFIFRAQSIQRENIKSPCCGSVLVQADFLPDLDYGDNLDLLGSLRRPFSYAAGKSNYKNYLARQGIYFVLPLKSSLQIILEPKKRGFNLSTSLFNLRVKMEAALNRNLAPLPASLVGAMVLGQRRNIPWLVNNAMIKSGTVHILVVSGFNVGIVILVVDLLLKIMRIRRKLRIIINIVCLIIYCFITGATNPVLRATIMGIIYLGAYFFQREPEIYNSWAIAALLILFFNPQQFFDLGFQLSFASVGAIITIYPKLKSFFRVNTCKSKFWRFMGEGGLVSFSAWLGTLGIIAYNFRIITPVTVLANIFIVPLAALITLCGFALIFFGCFCPFLAPFFGLTSALLINLLLQTNAFMIHIPGAYFYL